LPVGEYELESGMVLVVTEEGVIAEVKEKEAEQEVEVEVEASTETKQVEAQPKKVVESKEYHFSSEEIKAYVVSGEVTTQQSLDRNRLRNATL